MPSRDIRNELRPEDIISPEGQSPSLNPDSIQLQLDGAHQRTAINVVLSDFESAKRARMERDYGITSKGQKLDFDKWLEELTDMYYGKRRIPKTIPWRFCSSRSLMIAMAVLEVMHARLFPAVYNEELTRFRPTEKNDVEKAERVEKLMFWWIRVRSKLREFFDRWVRSILAYGGTLTETTWEVKFKDKGEQTPGSVITDETGQPLMNPDGSPSMIGPEKIMDRFEFTKSTIIPVVNVYLQPGSTDIQEDPVIIQVDYLFRELEEMERNGQAVNITTASDTDSKTLKDLIPVSGVAGEALSPEETDELKNVQRRNKVVKCLKWYGAIDLDGDGFAEQVRVLIAHELRAYLGGVQLKDISDRGMRPLDLTMYMPRVDEPQGLFGFGVLEQIKELSQEIDAIFNQMTDAHTLNVMRPGFYDPSGDVDAGAMNLAPNKLIPVSNPQANIYFPDFRVATDQLVMSVRLVLEFIERLTSASAFIFGKQDELAGGSGTATRTNAIISSAEQKFSIPAQRLREGSARIITQHLDLVQKNLPPGLEERVLGDSGQPLFQENELTRENVRGEFDCYLLPDESFGSKDAERQLSMLLYNLLLQNPIVATDPAKLYKTTSDVLKAFGKDPSLYLGPQPPLPGSDDPRDENQLMIQGDFGMVNVTMTQNHLEHVMVHQQLPQSAAFGLLTPEAQQTVMQFLQAHIQQHVQFFQAILQRVATQPKGQGSAPRRAGAQAGAAQASPPIGPEPGVGAVSNPLAEAQRVQRTGESQSPSPG